MFSTRYLCESRRAMEDSDGDMMKLMNKAMHAHAEYEQKWWKQDRRGRWVVLEPGAGTLLTGERKQMRDYLDAITSRRGRRFRSLAQARAFAREVGGEVRHWRRHMARRFGGHKIKSTWRYETNPWKDAISPLSMLELL